MNFEIIDEFDDKCFHHYDEILLFFHVFRLKIDMFVIIFRNFKFLLFCNEIQIRIIRTCFNFLNLKIIDDKCNDKKILLFRMKLIFKNDENNKNRKIIVSCEFLKRQYSICSIFAITINKLQKQFLRYVDVNIRIKNRFFL